MKELYFILLVFLCPMATSAQCYEPVPLESRMGEATIAAVGRVSSSQPFYNQFGEIYTKHVLEVDRVVAINGLSSLPAEIEFFTMGGVINDEQLVVYPSLRGIGNADGLFLFTEYTGDRVVSENRIFRPTAVHESYMAYDPETGNFNDGDEVIGNLQDVEEIVREVFGTGFTMLTARDFSPQPAVAGRMMPSISSISPLSVSAGIGEVITIDGSGFGSATGDVLFDSPDDGTGGAFTGVSDNDILSWTNTRIRVRVISEAGGGRVIVQTTAGQQVISSQQLDIDFAVTNLSINSGEIVTPRLIDDNADGDGGYALFVSNSNANNGRSLAGDAPALAALTRAVTTWQSQGDYNIRLEGTTSIQQPTRDDGVNIISYGSNAYDFDTELGSGTVGIAFSYYSFCGSSELELTGVDILFRRPGNPNGFGGSVNYNFGPGLGGGTDFESVALHEIGHTHQLKHVSDPGEVMSFRITQGQSQRILSTDTRAGADVVANLAISYDPPLINCGGDFNQEREYQRFSDAGGALPVRWAEFTAVSRAKSVDLRWSTASESENDFFTVERSVDGRNFRPLAQVGARNIITGSVYSAADTEPLAGISFYRIAQTDLNGSQSFSVIRQVSRSAPGTMVLFPNPVVNELTVIDPDVVAGERYDIFDGLGRRVRTYQTTGASGQVTIDVSDLAAGQYTLRTESGKSRRFIK